MMSLKSDSIQIRFNCQKWFDSDSIRFHNEKSFDSDSIQMYKSDSIRIRFDFMMKSYSIRIRFKVCCIIAKMSQIQKLFLTHEQRKQVLDTLSLNMFSSMNIGVQLPEQAKKKRGRQPKTWKLSEE